VHLRQLTLVNFRNYAHQELSLEPGPVLLLGENAQGKTNILEAVFLLATGRSERAVNDADFIAWDVRDDPQPFARIVGVAQRASGDITVELTVAGRAGANDRLIASKRFKLNGVARRGFDVAGSIMAVLFTTDDMDLVRGSPSERRRYLDVMLTQIDRPYMRALQRYGKVVSQRNALLKRIREGDASRDELAYWDDELARDGAVIFIERARALERLTPAAADEHRRLSGEREEFGVAYLPRLSEAWDAGRLAAAAPDDVAAALVAQLESIRARETGAGMTLAGPHRDDLALTLGGEPAASSASRGQQRTAALALRLAEARFLRERAGERPLLLLDDVLSELDAERRAAVLRVIDADQVLITSADADRFEGAFDRRAQQFRVEAGAVRRC
jgi:DNA replication and repair protein RecF